MEYFTSHIGVIAAAAILVAGLAVAWWCMLDYNSKLKARRAAARRAEAERKRLTQLFRDSGKYKVYPSFGNFILLKILDPQITSSMLFEKAIKKGLMIRDCSTFPTLSDRYIRMCFMNPSDNDKLVKVLTE